MEDSLEVAEAARALAGGALVCFPTETGYGLAADTGNAEAIEAVAALKGRGLAPIAAIAADLAQARALWASLPPPAADLAARFWPGPLTIVAPAAAGVSPRLCGPEGVGVRVSSHPIARGLAARLGRAITATSANPSGEAPAAEVAAARAMFGDRVAAYLDGGPAPGGPPSTVVAIAADGAIRVIRAGAVTL
jgi:L-threonylcarbamoyladenylate synthase